jgi:hypothetical protein
MYEMKPTLFPDVNTDDFSMSVNHAANYEHNVLGPSMKAHKIFQGFDFQKM